MLKYLLISFCIAAGSLAAQTISSVSVDENYYLGYSYEIDSSWIDVRLSNGELPRRADGTYLYWKTDANGNLIPVRRIVVKPENFPREQKYFYE